MMFTADWDPICPVSILKFPFEQTLNSYGPGVDWEYQISCPTPKSTLFETKTALIAIYFYKEVSILVSKQSTVENSEKRQLLAQVLPLELNFYSHYLLHLHQVDLHKYLK